MNSKNITKEYRLAKWAQIIKERQDSGQNIKDFCLSTGISRNAYYYWQRKLRAIASVELTNQEGSSFLSPIPDGWMQLESINQPEPSALNIEISGYRINVNNETDPELLKMVCRVLRDL